MKQQQNEQNYLNNVSKQQVGLAVHLLDFLELISETKTKSLKLQVCILTTYTLHRVLCTSTFSLNMQNQYTSNPRFGNVQNAKCRHSF